MNKEQIPEHMEVLGSDGRHIGTAITSKARARSSSRKKM